MANLGLQNNNPGNLKDPATNAFRQFASPDEGYNALLEDIRAKQSGKSEHIKPGASLEDFANVWAPASDKNDPVNYAKTLATHLGVDTTHPFDQVPPDQLAKAIQVAEGTSTMQTSSGNQLSHEQLTANINAMESQGASQEDIQSYLDSLKGGSQEQPKFNIKDNPSFTGTTGGMPNSTSQTADFNTIDVAKDIGKGLVTGTIESGKDLAAAIGSNPNSKTYGDIAKNFDALQKADQSYISNLIELRNQEAKAGNKEKVEHFQNLIKSYKTTDGQDLTTVFPDLNKSAEQVIGDFASMGLETVGAAEGAQGLGELTGLAAKTGAEEVATSLGKKVLKGSLVGGGYGAGFGAAGAMQRNAKSGEIATSAAVGGATGAVVGAVTTLAGEGLKKSFGGAKSAEEILATPEEEVNNLSPREQKLWYENKASTASESAQKAAEKATEEAKTKISDFSQKLADSNEKTRVGLKEPFKQLMRDSSDEYRALAEGSATNGENMTKTITSEDLAGKIDSKFEHDPQFAAEFKKTLGLGEDTDPLTNQELLDKARAIMADVSSSAKAGSRTYSSGEYEAMKKYSFIMETLGENGVDMSEANKFWREWAPVRERGVKAIQPFDESNVKKGSLGSTLNKAAKVPTTPAQATAKLDAQNFVKELESRMNLPKGSLSAETQDLMDQLEKAKLGKADAKKIATEATKQIKAELKLKKYDIKTAADRNKIIRSVIKRVIGAAVGAGLGKVFGGTPATIGGGIAGEVIGGAILP